MSDAEWVVVYSRQAQKDAHKLASSGLKAKAQVLLDLVAQDPFSSPPRFENLVGDLAGCYSRRINIQHRLVYEVLPENEWCMCCECGPATNDLTPHGAWRHPHAAPVGTDHVCREPGSRLHRSSAHAC